MEDSHSKIMSKQLKKRINLYVLVSNINITAVCVIYLICFYLYFDGHNNVMLLFRDIVVSMLSTSLIFFLCVTLPSYINKKKNKKRVILLKNNINSNIISFISIMVLNTDWQKEDIFKIRAKLEKSKRNIYLERADIIYTNSDGMIEVAPLTIDVIKTYIRSIEKQFSYLVDMFEDCVSNKFIDEIMTFLCSKSWIKLQIMLNFSSRNTDSVTSIDNETYENDFFNKTMPYLLFSNINNNNAISFIELAKRIINYNY